MTFTLQKRHRTTVSSSKRISNKKRARIRCALIISGAAVFILICACTVYSVWKETTQPEKKQIVLPQITIETQLLQKNEYSRPGLPLKEVKGIVVHYTANPGSDAMENRNYFNNLPEINKGKTKEKSIYASSHFVVGLEGQIVQCIPLDEMSYASNERNSDTISIECCHPDSSGEFNNATYESMVELVAYLCLKYNLTEEDVIRHYDVTGKNCPKYFVEHEDEWEQFKKQVKKLL